MHCVCAPVAFAADLIAFIIIEIFAFHDVASERRTTFSTAYIILKRECSGSLLPVYIHKNSFPGDCSHTGIIPLARALHDFL
jgi:hypothetical protein